MAELFSQVLDLKKKDVFLETQDNDTKYFSITGLPSTLSYGKHPFSITFNDPEDEPLLKNLSNIVFEFVDSRGTVIFSNLIDIEELSGAGNGFIWIKKDPLRTADEIADGPAFLYVMGELDGEEIPNDWKGIYNVRTSFTYDIRKDFPNTSPLVLAKPSDIQTNLSISETVEFDDSDTVYKRSFINVTLSDLETNGGKIESVELAYNEQKSKTDDFDVITSYPLTSGSFETDSQTLTSGLNPITNTTKIPTPKTFRRNTPVKFRLRFLSPSKQLAQYLDKDRQGEIVEVTSSFITFDSAPFFVEKTDNLLTGSLSVGREVGKGFTFSGKKSAELSTVDYKGFTSASLGLGPGILMYSGSVKDDITDDYSLGGVGLELVANSESFFRFRTNPSELDIRTNKFFIGSETSQFISASSGNIEISSSLFHLDPANNTMTLSGSITATDGTIGGYEIGQTSLFSERVVNTDIFATASMFAGDSSQNAGFEIDARDDRADFRANTIYSLTTAGSKINEHLNVYTTGSNANFNPFFDSIGPTTANNHFVGKQLTTGYNGFFDQLYKRNDFGPNGIGDGIYEWVSILINSGSSGNPYNENDPTKATGIHFGTGSNNTLSVRQDTLTLLGSSGGLVSGSAQSTGSFGSLVVADKVQGNLEIDGITILGGTTQLNDGTATSNIIASNSTTLLLGGASYWTEIKYGKDADVIHNFLGTFNNVSGSSTSTGSFGHLMVGGGNFTSASLAAGGSGGSGISNVVEDTTPQLGGDLDLNSNDITGTGNIDIVGNITAQNFIVSSSVTSIEYQSLSGSTIFGDSADDTHTFLGNTISGSSTSTGSFGTAHIADNLGIGTTNPTVGLQLGVSTSGLTKTAIFNSEGGGEVGLKIQSRTNRAKLRVADNDTSAYVVAEGGISSFGPSAEAATTNISVLSSGNVGIGTTTPSTNYPITIAKNESDEYDTAAYGKAMLRLENTNTGATQPHNLIHFRLEKNGGDGYLGFIAGGSVNEEHFVLGNQIDGEVLRVASGGKVGIGTTSPAVQLHLSSSTANNFRIERSGTTNAAVHFKNASEDWYAGVTSAENFSISRNADIASGTEFVIRGNTGRVGIGTSTPDGTLHSHTATAGSVVAHASADEIVAENDNDGGISILTPNNKIGGIFFGDPDDNNIGMIQYSHALNRFAFTAAASSAPGFTLTGNTAEFGASTTRISGSASSTGSFAEAHIADRVGIRTTNPATTLHIVGGVGGPGDGIRIERSGFSSNYMTIDQDSINTSVGSLRLQNDSGGGVIIGGDMDFDAVNSIKNIQQVSGSSTSTGSFAHGFIANNLGIGTTSPVRMLDIVGAGAAIKVDSSDHAYIELDRGATGNLSQVKYLTAGSAKWYAGLTDSDVSGFDGTEFFIGEGSGGASDAHFVIDGSGNVTLGSGVALEFGDSNTKILGSSANNYLSFTPNGTELLRLVGTSISGSAVSTGSFGAGYIDNKLGVGTVNPKAPIHIFEDNYSTVMADPIADTRLFVSDIDGGSHIGIQSKNDNSGSIYFGHRTEIEAAKIVWDNSTDSMNFYSGSTKMFRYGLGDEIRFFKSLNSNSSIVTLGGIHVGGTSDPGNDNLTVDGIISGSIYDSINVEGTVSASGYGYFGGRVHLFGAISIGRQPGTDELTVGYDNSYNSIQYGKPAGTIHKFAGTIISGSSTSTGSFGSVRVREKYELAEHGDVFTIKDITNSRTLFSLTTGAVITLGNNYGANINLNTSAGVVIPNGTGLNVQSGNISGSAASTGSFGHGFIADKLGIGTTSPAYPLHITGADSAILLIGSTQGRVVLQDTGATSNSQAFDIVSVADKLNFRRLNDARSGVNATIMSFDGDKVGIGTTAPERKLHVVGNPILIDNNQHYEGKDSGGTKRRVIGLDSSNNINIGSGQSGGSINFIEGDATHMSIDASGNVEFLTASTISGSATSTGSFGELIIDSNGTFGGDIDLEGDIDVNGTTNLDNVDIDGTVQIDGNTTFGVSGTGVDVRFYGDTAGRYISWDQSADQLKFQDNTKLVFGTGLVTDADSDAQIYYDGSNLRLVNEGGVISLEDDVNVTGNVSGSATSTGSFGALRAGSGSLLELGDTTFAGYVGMKTGFMGSSDYMIISGISDGNTYISAKDTKSVEIRGGGNRDSNKIVVPDNTFIQLGGSSTTLIRPSVDNQATLGTAALRFSDVFAVQTTTGGVFETGLRTEKIGDNPTGTIVSWEEDGLVPCDKNEDELVMGVIKKGKDEPIVLGAEPVLVTGKVNVGDYIVTSDKIGHGKSVKRGYLLKKDLFGKVIAQALESCDGDSNLIKCMIRKM
jgi:hypothetical protein